MSQPHKKFAKLREWNRRRNYYLKSLRMRIAKLLWDYRSRHPFDSEKIKKVLLLRDDGKIGDMVVSTSLVREFHTRGYIVDVLATPENYIIIKNNPFIRKVYISTTNNITNLLSAEQYDAVIDMGDKISPKSLFFLRKISAKNTIGFNKDRYNIYNKSICFNGYNQHISSRYAILMDQFGFIDYSVDYDLYIPPDVNSEILKYLKNLPGKYNIVINPFTASDKRDLSEFQLQQLVDMINIKYSEVNVLIIGQPERIKKISVHNAFIYESIDIHSVMSLIYHADLIISPDTSIVHIAATWRKPMVALYGNDTHGMFNNNDVWGPGYSSAIQITTDNKYQVISEISTFKILQAVECIFMKEV